MGDEWQGQRTCAHGLTCFRNIGDGVLLAQGCPGNAIAAKVERMGPSQSSVKLEVFLSHLIIMLLVYFARHLLPFRPPFTKDGPTAGMDPLYEGRELRRDVEEIVLSQCEEVGGADDLCVEGRWHIENEADLHVQQLGMMPKITYLKRDGSNLMQGAHTAHQDGS